MESFIGEIKIFAGAFAPMGWIYCNGQTIPINGNNALFELLGTTYGGDGNESFGIPDLRGRAPVHFGGGPGLTHLELGKKGGAETTEIYEHNLPAHNHAVSNVIISGKVKMKLGNAPGGEIMGGNNFIAFHGGTDDSIFTGTAPAAMTLNEDAIDSSDLSLTGDTDRTGSVREFNIRSPFIALNYIICTRGIFPPRD